MFVPVATTAPESSRNSVLLAEHLTSFREQRAPDSPAHSEAGADGARHLPVYFRKASMAPSPGSPDPARKGEAAGHRDSQLFTGL